MNLSQKDTNLLVFILIVILGAVFYFVPYKQIHKEEVALNNEIMNLEATYNQLSADILRKDEYLEGIETAKKTIEDLNKLLPSELSQEMLLFTINDIEKNIGINLPIVSFGDTEIIGTLQGGTAAEVNQTTAQSTAEDTQTTEVSGQETSVDNGNGLETAIKTTVSTATTLNYSQLKELLAYLYEVENASESKQRIVLNNLQLSTVAEDGDLIAAFTLSYYGLEDGREVEPIDLGTYDLTKDNVFDSFEGSDSGETETEERSDIFIIIDPTTADNMALTIGSNTGSPEAESIYADENDFVDVEFEFYQEDGIYYYRYKVGSESSPQNYNQGIAFDPGDDLELIVFSSNRNGVDDKSGVNATIINETDMALYIRYSGEDEDEPRFNIVETEGTVIVD